MGFFIAAHVGAGSHSLQKHPKYKKALCKACLAAEACLQRGGTAMQAVAAAIQVLEDDPITNAGVGSNLTESGHVEVDGSIMNGNGQMGAVGAVPGLRNPIVAASVLAERCWAPMPLGRVRPQLLVGEPARLWAMQQGLTVARTPAEAHQMLVTEQTHQAWRKYSLMIQQAAATAATPVATAAIAPTAAACITPTPVAVHEEAKDRRNINRNYQLQGTTSHTQHLPGSLVPVAEGDGMDAERSASKRQKLSEPSINQSNTVQCEEMNLPVEDALLPEVADTVGCICVDDNGHVAAGVSSGGIAMKADGRVGEAALPGCGCWAQHPASARPGVALSVSGVGERIMSAVLAKECGDKLQHWVRPPSWLSREGVRHDPQTPHKAQPPVTIPKTEREDTTLSHCPGTTSRQEEEDTALRRRPGTTSRQEEEDTTLRCRPGPELGTTATRAVEEVALRPELGTVITRQEDEVALSPELGTGSDPVRKCSTEGTAGTVGSLNSTSRSGSMTEDLESVEEKEEEDAMSDERYEDEDVHRTAGEVCCCAMLQSLRAQVGPRDAGVIAAVVHVNKQQVGLEFAAVHTAESFGMAFHHAGLAKPRAMMLQKAPASTPFDTQCNTTTCGQFGVTMEWSMSSRDMP